MPRILLGIPETEYSVVRTVVNSVINELFVLTGIPNDTRIFYPGSLGRTAQQGNTGMLGDVIDSKEDIALFQQHSKVFIEVQEQPDEDSAQLSDAFRVEQPALFQDPDLGIYIKPVYQQMEIKINFRYRAIDKTAADRWRHEMMSRLQARMEVRLHQLDYSFAIPPEFLLILKELHRVRENKFGYGEDYSTYFWKYACPDLTTLTNQSGEANTLVMPESQGRVQGWFDFSLMPEEGSRENDTANWNLNFVYTFKYAKPVSAVMGYPIVIHQQILDQKYRPDPKIDYPGAQDRPKERRSLSWNAMRAFEARNDYWSLRSRQGYGIPYYDEFLPSFIPKSTMRIMTVLAQVDPATPRVLFNINDVKQVKLKPSILAFLASESQYLSPTYNSFFTLDIYEGYNRLDPKMIVMDSNLNMRTTFDMDPRKQYHVRLGLVEDFRLLPPPVIDRGRRNPDPIIDIITTIDPTATGKTPPITGGVIKKPDWDHWIDTINNQNRDRYQFNTVQFLTIQAGELTDAMRAGNFDRVNSAY